MESILTSVKKLLGITEDYKHFDTDIILHINTVFMVLNQLGVGPSEGFSIEDDTSVWTDFISTNAYYKAEHGIDTDTKAEMFAPTKEIIDAAILSANQIDTGFYTTTGEKVYHASTLSGIDVFYYVSVANPSQLEAVKSYVYLKVKLLFDPPLSSSVIEATNRMISELEWRLNVSVDPSTTE